MASGRLTDHGGAPDRLAEGVNSALPTVGSGQERLEVWYPVMMARNFAELGLEGEVRLLDYLGAVEKGKLGNLGAKQRRLDWLVQGLRSGEWRPA